MLKTKRPILHQNCTAVRGIKAFECKRCCTKTNNYSNGIELCEDCCNELNVCTICGKLLDPIKFNIYAGLNGGFNSVNLQETDFFDSEELAAERARDLAVEEYEGYEGYHGLRTRQEIKESLIEEEGMQEEEVTDDLIEEYYVEEMEGWIEYWAIPADEDSDAENYL